MTFKRIFKEISKKSKINLSKNQKIKNFFNNETLEIRNNIHKKLFEKYDDLKLNNNLIYQQFKSLLSFKKTKPAIMSNDLYENAVINYIHTDTVYTEVCINPLVTTIDFINNKLTELYDSNHISLKMKNQLNLN